MSQREVIKIIYHHTSENRFTSRMWKHPWLCSWKREDLSRRHFGLQESRETCLYACSSENNFPAQLNPSLASFRKSKVSRLAYDGISQFLLFINSFLKLLPLRLRVHQANVQGWWRYTRKKCFFSLFTEINVSSIANLHPSRQHQPFGFTNFSSPIRPSSFLINVSHSNTNRDILITAQAEMTREWPDVTRGRKKCLMASQMITSS